MANLTKLIAGHAYWADKKRELKELGSLELDKCKKMMAQRNSAGRIVGIGKNCIEEAIEQTKAYNEGNQPYQDQCFEETWEVMVGEGEACEHCQKVRQLKRLRGVASRRLGAIRGAMTRVGRTLEYKDNA